MRNVIKQSVILPASPEKLFDMYLDPAEHEAVTGTPVKISMEAGSEFEAFNGMLTGTMLEVIRPVLIVQSWRSAQFKEHDADSTLILYFSSEEGKGKIDLIHLDVPDHDYHSVVEGWQKYYWEPWRNYLEG